MINKMTKFPSDALPLAFAAKKHGFTWTALHKAIMRGRLVGFQEKGYWYTTSRAIRKYLKTRDNDKIPKSYRKKA